MEHYFFKPDFKKADGTIDVDGIGGYVQALSHLEAFLNEKTNQWNPLYRYVDALALNADMRQALTMIQDLHKQAKNDLGGITGVLQSLTDHFKLPENDKV